MTPPDRTAGQSEGERRCGEVMTHEPHERCELAMGHDGWHSFEEGNRRWTSSERADLERRVKDAESTGWLYHLTAVLDDVGESLRSESIDEARETVADYRRRYAA